MSTLLLDPPSELAGLFDSDTGQLFEVKAFSNEQCERRPLTLDSLITSLWADIAVGQIVRCPVCNGSMRPRLGGSASSARSDCLDCGASLS